MIVLAAVIADLCAAPPAPAPTPDPADAATYAAVGDDARAHGEIRVAAIAYARALALDPHDAAAKAALAALCRDDARASAPENLLAAIEALRRGEVDAARAAFAALVDTGGAAAAGAHFFLGLIALRRHDARRARRELELAARDPSYADPARGLLRLAHRDGRIAAVLLAEPEVDTNPSLLPDTPPAGAVTGPAQPDEDLLLVGTLTVRPARWLALRDTVSWRNQRQQTALDYLGENAHAAIELGEGADRLAIQYDLDDDVLDGSAYLVAHKGSGTYRHELGRVELAASYSARYRGYRQAAEAGFTGWVHAAELDATVHLTPRVDLELAALGWRELTADPGFSDFAGGGRASLRARIGSAVRIAGSLAAWGAAYDAAEPDGTLRRDSHEEANADLEVDLDDHVLAVAGTSLELNQSTVEDFDYWQLVVRAGIALAFGGP